MITLSVLTIIGCAALCLTLPGVNSMSQIVYPVICPSAGVLLLAIPSWILSVVDSRKQTRLLDPLIQQLKADLDGHLPGMLGKDRRDWIINHALPLDQGWIDGGKLISSLKKHYPEKTKDQSQSDKFSLRALDQVLRKLMDSVERDEWDEKINTAKQKIDRGLAAEPADTQADWIIQTLKDQEDKWADKECIEAIRDLIDCYLVGPPEPREVFCLKEALTSLNVTMYA